MRATAAKPAMAVRFSVPDRRPNSCPPAVQQGLDRNLRAANQRRRAIARPQLVPRQGHQIDPERHHIERYPPRRLAGVAMEIPPRGMDNLGDLGNRLDHAGLVVREHHRDHKLRATPQFTDSFYRGKIHHAIVLNPQGDRIALRLQHR